MEPHKELSSIESWRPDLDKGPDRYFLQALSFAREFYGDELERMSSVKLEDVDADFFFREYVWVVHATGFSAKAVGKFMPRLMDAYGPWRDLGSDPDYMVRVSKVCNNPQKASAVASMAKAMKAAETACGWEEYRKDNLSSVELLRKLPYIGKVTCYHLGRNIGLLDCVKPDLHLVRLAEHWGFKGCEEMCRSMQKLADPERYMPLGIVDLILWYAASTFGTLEVRTGGAR